MIYLNNASTTFPKPETVYQAVDYCMRNSGWSEGRGTASEKDYILQETRELLAQMIHAEDSYDIVLTFHATHALNLAIKGFLKKGDHVIMTSLEHNSVIRPLKHLEKDGMIELSVVKAEEDGTIHPEDISNEIKNSTRLIVTPHIPNVLGNIIPIEAIGRIAAKNKIAYLVDASQSIGVLDIDVRAMQIDMLAFPGHKGLYGPTGTGALYIRKEIELEPLMYGGTGSISEPLLQPEALPYRYESGTPNNIGIAGLNAGIKFVLQTGIQNIRRHEEELIKYLYQELLNVSNIKLYGPERLADRVGIVSLNLLNKHPLHVSRKLLLDYNILTRPGLQCAPLTHQTIGSWVEGTVRISVGYFNTIEDIKKAVDAINKINKDSN